VVRMIKRQLMKRALDMLGEIAKREDPADYAAFWEAFGRNIKLGVIEDQSNRDVLAKLLRWVGAGWVEGEGSCVECSRRPWGGGSGTSSEAS
jgi:HSP90 family molecular chaperone